MDMDMDVIFHIHVRTASLYVRHCFGTTTCSSMELGFDRSREHTMMLVICIRYAN